MSSSEAEGKPTHRALMCTARVGKQGPGLRSLHIYKPYVPCEQ